MAARVVEKRQVERGKRHQMKPDEKAFEEHVAGSLIMEGGGYLSVEVGDAAEDRVILEKTPPTLFSTVFGTM